MPPVRDGVLAPTAMNYKNTTPYQPGQNSVAGAFANNLGATLNNGVAGTANLANNLGRRGYNYARDNFGVPAGGPAIKSLTDSMNTAFNRVSDALKMK